MSPFVAWALLVAGGGVPGGAPPPALTEVREIRRLSADEAARALPVRLKGIVTYYHFLPEWNPLFVQDGTGGIYVELGAADPHLDPGDVVEVEGVTGPGRFAPLVRQPTIRRLARSGLPPPTPRTIDELLTGAWDSQWIEVEGVVRHVERHPSAGLLLITLVQNRRPFRCVVRAPDVASPPALVDARVSVRGAAGTLFTSKRQILGVQVFAPGLDEVRVITPAAADPFDRPIARAGDLFRFDPAWTPGGRVRVRGTVTAVGGGSAVYLRDETGGLKIEMDESPADLRRGDVLDVVGFPEVGAYSPWMGGALARRLGRGPAPEAPLVTIDDVLTGDYDSLPVRLDAVVIDQAALGAGSNLTLKAEDRTFQAVVAARVPDDLRSGSLVRLRGICLVQPGPDNRVRTFHLALDSSDDVTILEAGSWWTVERALWILVGLGAVALLSVAWNVMLRRRVDLELARVRMLRGLLPICAWCKKIRDDRGYWSQVETYIHQHSAADFSHGICPECQDRELGRFRGPS
jgi:hypothetical protein